MGLITTMHVPDKLHVVHCVSFRQLDRYVLKICLTVFQVIGRFLKHANIEVRGDAIMIMSSLVNETEANILEDSGQWRHLAYCLTETCPYKFCVMFTVLGATKFIMSLLRKAMSSLKRKASDSQGSFSAVELLSGINRIAVNDSNKTTVCKAIYSRRISGSIEGMP